jgi:proteic killer suppression protein
MILRYGNCRSNRRVSAHARRLVWTPAWKSGQRPALSLLYRHEIHFPLIRSFRHRGLQHFFETGSKAGIQPRHAGRLRLQLSRLHLVRGPREMDRPGWRLHPLKGDLSGHWAVWVDKSWRLTFRFDGDDVEVVDYQDYH